ncbi:toxin ParE1/3/4 [Aequitasia blattaphilus]|uniref:Type II toxin-antitoxin system RelE/ParE family toxin n=1 Tax=Aequitasia blattaphilus TaxID=2949332 RepID=A0ABT1E614_9FIRM|nr:type II toxin-antitoxin system RelE/ParE family toxin [Aequitasia blattaphilus]MCP1101277.1 type II toxin-antitoxin system RelE/ParE family toxin [Aequitasia blattaphilus]MCR8613917.1 type II toxin-antitoxin system RelE/ParE family toxin [Aequitasia blattaphilus]
MNYKLQYLSLFEEDLLNAVLYISEELNNPYAAQRLIDDVERSILRRLVNPLSFEPFVSSKARDSLYYRIYVRNYTVYYVVIDEIMEVRRLLYNACNTDVHL